MVKGMFDKLLCKFFGDLFRLFEFVLFGMYFMGVLEWFLEVIFDFF